MRTALGLSALALLIVIPVLAGTSSSTPAKPQIQRGRYLVTAVAGCGDCHTPMLPTGAPDVAHQLQGTKLFFAPLHPVPNWADTSPAIAGLPGLTDEQVITLLETGKLPNGVSPRPPMPTYHMHPRDAEAVVAYLRSLETKQ